MKSTSHRMSPRIGGAIFCMMVFSAQGREFGWTFPVSGAFNNKDNWSSHPYDDFPAAGDLAIFTSGSGYTVTCNGDASGTTEVGGNVTFQLNGNYSVSEIRKGEGRMVLLGPGTLEGGAFYLSGNGPEDANNVEADGAGLIMNGVLTDFIYRIIGRNGAQIQSSGLTGSGTRPLLETGAEWRHSGLHFGSLCIVNSGALLAADEVNFTRAELDGGRLQSGPLFIGRLLARNGAVLSATTATLNGGSFPALLEGGGTKMMISGALDAAFSDVEVKAGAVLSVGSLASMGTSFYIVDGSGSQITAATSMATASIKVHNQAQGSTPTLRNCLVEVSNPGSAFTISGRIDDAAIQVLNGATASAGSAAGAGLVVNGAGSAMEIAGNVESSPTNVSQVEVGGGASLVCASAVSGGGVGDEGSIWKVGHDLVVGDGPAQVRLGVASGGRLEVRGGSVRIGRPSGSDGVVEVGDFRDISAPVLDTRLVPVLEVGVSGKGLLRTAFLGEVLANDLSLGLHAGSDGAVEVYGGPFRVSGALSIGGAGLGRATIGSRGTTTVKDILVGRSAEANSLRLLNAGTTLTVSNALSIGETGTGQLTIESGATLLMTGRFSRDDAGGSGEAGAGASAGSTGAITVRGSGSRFTGALGILGVGVDGHGTLDVTTGGTVDFGAVEIGLNAPSTGATTVSGAGSTLKGPLAVGDMGQGTLVVTDGGTVSSSEVLIGAKTGSSGEVTVSGVGSTMGGPKGIALTVGGRAPGRLNVTAGGVVEFGMAYVGADPGALGNVTVSGGGSILRTRESCQIGSGSPGQVTVSSGGLLRTGPSLEVAKKGTLTLSGGSVVVGAAAPTAVPGKVVVGNLGEFKLAGLLNGSVEVREGGTFLPGASPGKAAVTGDVSFNTGSVLEAELGGAESGVSQDIVEAAGSVVLAGQLRVVFRDGFAPVNGQALELIKAGSVSGDFTQVRVKGLAPGFTYTLTKPGGNRLLLTATSASTAQSQPELSIVGSAGTVVVSWPSYVTEWTLQRSVGLGAGSWLPVPAPGNQFIAPAPVGNAFFRLIHP